MFSALKRPVTNNIGPKRHLLKPWKDSSLNAFLLLHTFLNFNSIGLHKHQHLIKAATPGGHRGPLGRRLPPHLAGKRSRHLRLRPGDHRQRRRRQSDAHQRHVDRLADVGDDDVRVGDERRRVREFSRFVLLRRPGKRRCSVGQGRREFQGRPDDDLGRPLVHSLHPVLRQLRVHGKLTYKSFICINLHC